MVQVDAAKGYFQPLRGRAGHQQRKDCYRRTLFHLTPYANASLVPLYSSKRVQPASQRLDVDRYRWRVDLDRWVADSMRHIR